jgi:uncharacterized protein YjbJ (UPF0337 family)
LLAYVESDASEACTSGLLPPPASLSRSIRREQLDVSRVENGQFVNRGATTMGSTADKVSGLANEAAGKAKQGIGNMVGSDKLKAEGAAQELKGDAQKATGDAKAAVKNATNKTADAINKNL